VPLVDFPVAQRDVFVQRRDQIDHLPGPRIVGRTGPQGLERRTANDGDVVSGEFALGEEFAQLRFHQFEQFLVVDHVAVIQEHDDVGYPGLLGMQDVLLRLGHGAVRR